MSLGGGVLKLTNPSGTNLNFARNTTVTANTQIISDVTVASTAGNTYTLGTLSIGAQTLSIAKGANVSDANAAVTFGNLTLTGNATVSAAANSTLYFTGSVSNGGSLTVAAGAGTVSFSNNAASISPTSLVIDNGATVNLTGNNAIDNTSLHVPVTVNGTLDDGSNGEIFGALNGSGTINQAGNLFYTNSASNGSFSGVITGNGGYFKQLGGTQILSGLSSYTGSANATVPSTTIQGGTLSINTIGNVNGGNSAVGNPSSVFLAPSPSVRAAPPPPSSTPGQRPAPTASSTSRARPAAPRSTSREPAC